MRLNDSEIERFREDGFLILPKRFSAEEVALLKAELPRLFAERRPENFREKESDAVRTAMGLHLRSEVYARAVRDPRLVEPARQLLGEDLYVQQVKVNAKAAFSGDAWQWHYDFATHHSEDGVPEPLALNLHVFLDEVNEFNGPLVFIPASHRRGPAPATLDTETTSYPLWVVEDETVAKLIEEGGLVSAKGPPGTMLIFGDTLVHGSSLNTSPWPRTIFSLILNPVSNALTRRRRPDHQHHRDLTPVAPLPSPRPLAANRASCGDARVNRIVLGENLAYLERAPREAFSLIYIDPPFNTGRRQSRTRLRTVADRNGDRTGFQGKRYRTERLGETGFEDRFDDYIGFLRVRMEAARRTLTPGGSLFLHVDYREVHYCKVMLDEIFGRDSFMNEIVWAYDYGARSRRRWSAKHDNLLWYVNDPDRYTFNYDEIDRIPYMAPGLVGPEKAARGKTPTDVWWHTIVSPNGREKTGYATQKPLGILERIVRVHSNPGDRLLDFFAGSGSLGEAAARHGREFVLVDNNPEAVRIMLKRLAEYHPEVENRNETIPAAETQLTFDLGAAHHDNYYR